MPPVITMRENMNETTETTKAAAPKTQGSIWIRLLYMVLFVIIFGVAEFVLYLTAAIGFVFRLFGMPIDARVRKTGHAIGLYIKQIADYLSFNTESAPFPFGSWPEDNVRVVTNTNVD